MRVLLDEMLDRRLKRSLPQDMEAVTVRERGWGAKENGELVDRHQLKYKPRPMLEDLGKR